VCLVAEDEVEEFDMEARYEEERCPDDGDGTLACVQAILEGGKGFWHFFVVGLERSRT
jgi:hypothetical protein